MVRAAASVLILAVWSGLGLASPARAGTQIVGASYAVRCLDFAQQGSRAQTAINICNAALGEEPMTPRNRAGTLVNRGVLHMNRGDYAAASADFEAALQLQPALGEAHFNRGSLRVAEGRFSDGVADIDTSLRLGLRQPEKAYYNRAIAREALSDTRGAYLDYREAARLKPAWELPRIELARFTVRSR